METLILQYYKISKCWYWHWNVIHSNSIIFDQTENKWELFDVKIKSIFSEDRLCTEDAIKSRNVYKTEVIQRFGYFYSGGRQSIMSVGSLYNRENPEIDTWLIVICKRPFVLTFVSTSKYSNAMHLISDRIRSSTIQFVILFLFTCTKMTLFMKLLFLMKYTQ